MTYLVVAPDSPSTVGDTMSILCTDCEFNTIKPRYCNNRYTFVVKSKAVYGSRSEAVAGAGAVEATGVAYAVVDAVTGSGQWAVFTTEEVEVSRYRSLPVFLALACWNLVRGL